ncbi:MAG: rod shape-determining protein MreC [Candidatus Lambdaproteobacteria bacterium RIFOXYD1_FULL_56_27]|uniref:Cell shape-determining protein MreC n=1 Tax=Candidatus Lambdaproteobacteria bacterium RIFOXYD2_FULL_56_26 TaxID=1817773 RepID=A0A1F6H0Y7_9PROT|nr:MAG: rod shape-determining protein MreC [Candidatus Lambdaproteobacteria bacterium RIFOXYC1_FULL_56_13]OGH04009.1 MAG: rod shape-determining protein MreC [Candidatus Lambdaproteobacteria bacterium RIFOXYD2_FULL_56_26]OGH08892.1 MAG: rod shape-determining protein MreC [Candidatus Lambdaproteobacteria bacterium RIFOXYD1_FULL_56_27]
MFNFLKRYRFRISIGLILAVLMLSLLGQVESRRNENWFSYAIQTLTHPLLSVTHSVGEGVKNLWLGYVWLVNARSENEALKAKLRELTEQVAHHQEIVFAYERQKQLLQFAAENQDEKVFAEVVGEVERGFSRLLVLNKGSRYGIKKNFAVVTPDGVVGKIQSVTPFESVVQLITDPNSQFPVLVQETRAKAMVEGNLEGGLKILHFPRRMVIEKGDMVISSGLSGIYPKGFRVGTVSGIEKKEFGLFQTLTLTPYVDLNRIEEVAVILRAKGNPEPPLFTD